MKKNLFIITTVVLILATACNSGINDNMTFEEFQNYLEKNSNDSIKEAGECYYKVLKDGTALAPNLTPERLYSEYDITASSLTGKEISKKHIVLHGNTYQPKPLPTDIYKALGGETMNEGLEVEIYMSQDDAKKCELLDSDCEYPMVKVNFKKVNVMREFTVYVADKEAKVKFGDDLKNFLEATAMMVGNNGNIMVGKGIQIQQFNNGRYIVYFMDQKRGCCVNLVYKTQGDGAPLEWVSFYKRENGVAKEILPDVDSSQPNKEIDEDAFMVPTSMDEYNSL